MKHLRMIDHRFTIWGSAAVAALLTVAAAWLLAHEGHAPLPTRGAQIDRSKGRVVLSAEARAALDVQTAEVRARSVPASVLAYATLVSPWQKRAFVTSRLAGRVVKLHARPGQAVAAGELLAEVESAELAGLQQELLAARTERDLAAQVIRDLESAGPGGAVAELNLLEARNRLRQAENALDVSRKKWLGLGLSAADLEELLRSGTASTRTLPVTSSVAGIVVRADVAVGQVVDALTSLFEVTDLSTVWARIDVLEQDLHRVAPGQAVELRLPAYPGEVLTAKVQVVGPALDPQTHLNAVWVELSNPSGAEPRLLPGLTGEARLLLPGPAAATAVPAAAIFPEGAERYVLVEEAATRAGSEYQRRAVEVGRRADGWAEVRGGLFVGDRVVTQGGHQLAGLFVPEVLRPSPEAARAMGLTVEPARPQVVEDVLEIDGEVDLPPAARAAASAPVAGTLVKVHADRGQTVRAGDVLAEVFSLEFLGQQLDLLRADLEARLAEESLARLRGSASSPRRRLLELEGQASAARQRREALRSKLLIAGVTPGQIDTLLKDRALVPAAPVRAPVAGVVVSFDRVLGQAVRAEEPVFTVHDQSQALVEGYVPARDLGRLGPGQPVRVRLTADPAFRAEGTVVRSGRVIGADGGPMSVWVELKQPPARPLRHGQLARLALTVAAPAPVLAVPHEGVVTDGAQAFVFVRKDNGAFERRPVVVGRADDRFVEIVSGLAEGELVAVRGAAGLQAAHAVVR